VSTQDDPAGEPAARSNAQVNPIEPFEPLISNVISSGQKS
jgi:hypothetical protein